MKRLFNFIVILVALFCWICCENLVEEDGPIEYSKPSSVGVSASNSRESLDITLKAKPSGQSIQSVASASFAYSFSEDLADATTVNAVADDDVFTATFRSLEFGKRLYYQATLVNALGAQRTSSVGNILVPLFGEFVKVSTPELVELTSSNITLKSEYQSVEGIAIAECGFCWSTELAVPNIDNNRVIAESDFQTAIEGLGQMQTINARAYVKDASGNIAYSEVEQFTTDAVHVSEVSLNKTELELNEGESQTLTAIIKPDDASNKNVSWTSSDTGVATVDANGKVAAVKAGSATITVTTVDGGKTASCTVIVTAQSYSSEYVDLGLSVKWATCNLGVSKPEEHGLYYQWGDIRGYSSNTSDGMYFNWSNNGKVTYKWCNGSYDTLTKYNTRYYMGPVVDNKTVLDPADDAAHVALGGKWRMPTDAEWTELRTSCTWTWTTVNGINGCRVTSKKSGYTDKSIFLPAAGYRSLDNLINVGSDGLYWSSSLNTDYPIFAYLVDFDSSNVNLSSNYRQDGQSIRPVSE